ncbi:MAG: type II toxin-antitoxin system RelE/ParE family toxin [Nitrospira sp.]|nr:type II toxin-antitoxin system RelE/ParE family toxin [Nitrospira sp.]MBS0152738.1 type II toxin-antitoxin system RelE/ParE family toxin [Nitrospira sp.]MBX3320923.1 type II toxin-antitoxin system RelE/ParE family toxin [Nitrospira sp.]MBX3348627.1 type II toxin-antitoxin system RelE/ParE family toxin [Nitrospira sp.]MDR4466446.1 type II toxin-antitoxin system RelE/ParE family toxin [Nitrospira sp.]
MRRSRASGESFGRTRGAPEGSTVASGVQDLRVWDETGAYRVFYVAKFQEAVYVLHVFGKRSQKTARPDIELGKNRYADLLMWRREEGL